MSELLWEQQIKAVEERISIRFEENEDAQLLATMFGVSRFIALAIACRIGSIDRCLLAQVVENVLRRNGTLRARYKQITPFKFSGEVLLSPLRFRR